MTVPNLFSPPAPSPPHPKQAFTALISPLPVNCDVVFKRGILGELFVCSFVFLLVGVWWVAWSFGMIGGGGGGVLLLSLHIALVLF